MQPKQATLSPIFESKYSKNFLSRTMMNKQKNAFLTADNY